MADHHPRINAVAVGVIVQNEHILLEPMAPWLNTGLMWRPIGGFIEFGEYAADAVVREFQEELAREVEVVRLLEVYENLASFDVASGPLSVHETVFLHELRFAARDRPDSLGPLESFEQAAPDGEARSFAHWLPAAEVLRGEHPVFPPNLPAMLPPLLE